MTEEKIYYPNLTGEEFELTMILELKRAISVERVLITNHARQEADNDNLRLDEICWSVNHGEVIENYPDDQPFPSCLIVGMAPNNDPIHSVWAYNSQKQIAILITVYRPDPDKWIDGRERKKPC